MSTQENTRDLRNTKNLHQCLKLMGGDIDIGLLFGEKRIPQSTIMRGPTGAGKTQGIIQLAQSWANRHNKILLFQTCTISSIDSIDVRGPVLMAPPFGKDSAIPDAYKRIKMAPSGLFGMPPIARQVWGRVNAILSLSPAEAAARYGEQWNRKIEIEDIFVVLFLDEFFQSEAPTQKALAGLLLEQVLGDDYPMPPLLWVPMASNRIEDDAGVENALRHIPTRLASYWMKQDREVFCSYASTQNIIPPIVSWVHSEPELEVALCDKPGSDEDDGLPISTSRTLFMADAALKYWTGWKPTMSVDDHQLPRTQQENREAFDAVVARIGLTAAERLWATFMFKDELSPFKDIVAAPHKAVLPSNPGIQYYAVSMVLNELERLASQGELSSKIVEPASEYCLRFPKVFQANFVRAFQKLPATSRIGSKAVQQWRTDRKNAALVFNAF